jgi:hypothetical protein
MVILGGSGYVMNIYKFAKCDFEAPYKAEVIRGVGIFIPYGIVTGWMDIEDGEYKLLCTEDSTYFAEERSRLERFKKEGNSK